MTDKNKKTFYANQAESIIKKLQLQEKMLEGNMHQHLIEDFEDTCHNSVVYLGSRNGELRITHHIFILFPSYLTAD